MKVISLKNSKPEVIAKEIEGLSESNEIELSNLIYAKDEFHILVYIKLPNGQVGKVPKAQFKIKKETLEKWKSEDPSLPQIKALEKMGYKNKEILSMSKFKAYKLIGGKDEKA